MAGHYAHLSSNFRANLQPWAVAWEDGTNVLWIATGFLKFWDNEDAAYKEGAKGLHRIDFKNPDRIEVELSSGWGEKKRHPSPVCKAALNKVFAVAEKGEVRRKTITWATANPIKRPADSLTVQITVSAHDGSINVGRQQARKDRININNLLDPVVKERARLKKQWRRLRSLPKEHVDQKIRPYGKIVLPPATPETKIAEIMKACAEAGIGSQPREQKE